MLAPTLRDETTWCLSAGLDAVACIVYSCFPPRNIRSIANRRILAAHDATVPWHCVPRGEVRYQSSSRIDVPEHVHNYDLSAD